MNYKYSYKVMKKIKKINNVKFKNIVDVRIIPIHTDNNLWWSPEDMLKFRFECYREIVELLSYRKEMSYNDAMKLLYQPDNIRYDKSNFEVKTK
jgi:hypothetical protein